MVVPLGTVHAPLAPMQVELAPLQSEPLRCRTCAAILNPYCQVDFRSKIWVCPFCSTNNSFPQQYAEISESCMPTELYQQCTTVEYKLREPASPPPFFLFVVDLCVGHADPTDLDALRDTLLKAINWLPPTAQVGVITYGTCVHVHELASTAGGTPKSFTFKGCKEYDTASVIKMLRLPVDPPAPDAKGAKGPPPRREPRAVPSKFFASLEEAEETLTTIFDEVAVDPWPVERDRRQRRCTGAALSIATAIGDALYGGVGGRIMLFVSGPCTEGPGMTVDTDFANMIRGHNDIKDDTPAAKYWTKSKDFYEKLSTRIIRNGHCVDAFLNALDQVGFAEMRSCVYLTGGTCLLADSFKNVKFVESFQKFFRTNNDRQLAMAFDAKIEVQTSPQWKIAGATGPIISTNKRTASVHPDCELGIGNTAEWAVSCIDERTHLAFFFEVANLPEGKVGNFRFVQFATRYVHCTGERRLRITTACHRIAPANSKPQELAQYFDQEVAACLMARLSAHKAEHEVIFDVMRWLDRHLIKLVARFATYEKERHDTLRLCPQMSMFPQFMFHLRRSPFLHVFNSSPDETVFFRLWLDRESVDGAIVMMQPALFAYDLQGGPRPVLLDSSSVTKDSVLLLDEYFNVVVHYGEMIASWRDQGYAEKPDMEHFRQLLLRPKEQAMDVVRKRYPQPRFVECDHHGSQARLLYNVINPSVTHNQGGGAGGAPADQYGANQGEIVYTDDAPMATFMEHLKKLAVQN